jgi:hypothetical protein
MLGRITKRRKLLKCFFLTIKRTKFNQKKKQPVAKEKKVVVKNNFEVKDFATNNKINIDKKRFKQI